LDFGLWTLLHFFKSERSGARLPAPTSISPFPFPDTLVDTLLTPGWRLQRFKITRVYRVPDGVDAL